jgi:nucleolar protein 56
MSKRKVYLVLTSDSFVILDEEGGDLVSEPLGSGSEDVARAHQVLSQGKPTSQLSAALSGFRGEVIVETEALAKAVKQVHRGPVRVEFPSWGGRCMRRRITPAGGSKAREIAVRLASERVRQSYENWDRLVVRAVASVDEIDRSMANLYARCRDWYGVHFPELERIVKNERQYSELVAGADPKMDVDLSEAGVSDDRRRRVRKAAGRSLGVTLDPGDLDAIRHLARAIIYLDDRKSDILAYLSELMVANAPSLTKVAEAAVAARLIARAGSIRKLALMPSTSVQTLGAEKALFRHITRGARPPKHGIIFQHPYVRNSPKNIRGKVAGLLASSISLAARTDYISREDKGVKLRSALDAAVTSLRRERS